MNKSIFGDVLQQFSERLAQCENFSEIGGGKIGAGASSVWSFAADLNYTDHFVARKNRSTDNFLNCLARIDATGLHAFENGSVTRGGKIVVDLGAAFPNGACRKSGVTRQRNEAHISQCFREQ